MNVKIFVYFRIILFTFKFRNPYKKKRKKHVRRAQSASEFDPADLSTAINKRNLFKYFHLFISFQINILTFRHKHCNYIYRLRSTSSEHENSETEQSEKSPLVTAKLETFAKLLFSRSMTQESTSSSKDNVSPTRLIIMIFIFIDFKSYFASNYC